MKAEDIIRQIIDGGQAQVIKRSWSERILTGHLGNDYVEVYFDMLPQYLMPKYMTVKSFYGEAKTVPLSQEGIAKDSYVGEFLIV